MKLWLSLTISIAMFSSLSCKDDSPEIEGNGVEDILGKYEMTGQGTDPFFGTVSYRYGTRKIIRDPESANSVYIIPDSNELGSTPHYVNVFRFSNVRTHSTGDIVFDIPKQELRHTIYPTINRKDSLIGVRKMVAGNDSVDGIYYSFPQRIHFDGYVTSTDSGSIPGAPAFREFFLQRVD